MFATLFSFTSSEKDFLNQTTNQKKLFRPSVKPSPSSTGVEYGRFDKSNPFRSKFFLGDDGLRITFKGSKVGIRLIGAEIRLKVIVVKNDVYVASSETSTDYLLLESSEL